MDIHYCDFLAQPKSNTSQSKLAARTIQAQLAKRPRLAYLALQAEFAWATIRRNIPDQTLALHSLANFAFSQGDFSRARSLARRGLGLAESANLHMNVTVMLVELASIEACVGNLKVARDVATCALEANHRYHAPVIQAMAASTLGQISLAYFRDGDLAEACLSQSHALYEQMGDRAAAARVLNARGIAASLRDEHPLAQACFRGAAQSFEALQMPAEAQASYSNLVANQLAVNADIPQAYTPPVLFQGNGDLNLRVITSTGESDPRGMVGLQINGAWQYAALPGSKIAIFRAGQDEPLGAVEVVTLTEPIAPPARQLAQGASGLTGK